MTETGWFQLNDAQFFLGPENELLRSTVRGFVERDQPAPLVSCQLLLHGAPGSGKSSLAKEIATAWSASRGATMVITTGSDLGRSLSESIKTGDSLRLHRSYQNTPLLVVDDVHHLSGKSAAQEWLCQLLDHRGNMERPTIITSPKPVLQLHKISSRLTSRLFAGLNIGIQLPTRETRLAIIGFATVKASLALDAKEINHLVDVTGGLPISNVLAIADARRTADSSAKETCSDEDVSRLIIRVTAKKFGVKVRDVHGSSRRKSIVVPRAVAMFLIREYTRLSLVDVGKLFRRRDHTTVRHACLKVQKLITLDSTVRDAIASIREAIEIQPRPRPLEAAG